MTWFFCGVVLNRVSVLNIFGKILKGYKFDGYCLRKNQAATCLTF